MIQRRASGSWVIVLSFFGAYFLTVLPLPLWVQWARPEWVALVLIYWVVALPQRIGILAAFCAGLVLDSIEGSLLGQNAFALSVVAFLVLIMYQRLRLFNVWQQAAVVFLLLGLNQMLGQWIQNFTSVGATTLLFMLPALIGAALWPLIFTVLRRVRRSFDVH